MTADQAVANLVARVVTGVQPTRSGAASLVDVRLCCALARRRREWNRPRRMKAPVVMIGPGWVDLPFASRADTWARMAQRCVGWVLGTVLASIVLAAPARAAVCYACICTGQDFAAACRFSDPFSILECDAVCGAGNSSRYTFDTTCADIAATRCPTSETGHCTDGINNDGYQNDVTDCADSACFSDPACRVKAPTLSHTALTLVGLFLLGSGAWLVRRGVTR